MPRKVQTVTCAHTDRPHHAKGLCKACYFKQYNSVEANAERRRALARKSKAERMKDPEYAARQRKIQRDYYHRHREKKLERSQRYRDENRDEINRRNRIRQMEKDEKFWKEVEKSASRAA